MVFNTQDGNPEPYIVMMVAFIIYPFYYMYVLAKLALIAMTWAFPNTWCHKLFKKSMRQQSTKTQNKKFHIENAKQSSTVEKCPHWYSQNTAPRLKYIHKNYLKFMFSKIKLKICRQVIVQVHFVLNKKKTSPFILSYFQLCSELI